MERIHCLLALLVGLVCFGVVACVQGGAPQTGEEYASLSYYPLAEGTTWVYTYVPYEPQLADPTQLLTATYILTETVLETRSEAPYLFVKMRQDFQLVSENSLVYGQPQPSEFWYVISGTLVFKEGLALQRASFNPQSSELVYAFPLADRKQWCPTQLKIETSIDVKCEALGKRMVVGGQGSYRVPAGKFDDCYKLAEIYDSGGVIHEFCNGVGVVKTVYDQTGSPFGYEKMLIDYKLP